MRLDKMCNRFSWNKTNITEGSNYYIDLSRNELVKELISVNIFSLNDLFV